MACNEHECQICGTAGSNGNINLADDCITAASACFIARSRGLISLPPCATLYPQQRLQHHHTSRRSHPEAGLRGTQILRHSELLSASCSHATRNQAAAEGSNSFRNRLMGRIVQGLSRYNFEAVGFRATPHDLCESLESRVPVTPSGLSQLPNRLSSCRLLFRSPHR